MRVTKALPRSCCQRPVLDFLAPSLAYPRYRSLNQASFSTSSRRCGDAKCSGGSERSKRPTRPLTREQVEFLERAIRVNHAGEVAATRIYEAQTPPLVGAHPHLRPLMKHMYDQEAGHLKVFNDLITKRRIRPTALSPIWGVAATTLGWSTALMGREAAMACTEAVETEIGEHYNNQVRELLKWIRESEERGEEVGDEIRDLLKTVRRIRDEELEHLDHAVEHDAQKAEAYPILSAVIRGGCRGAIWLTERV